MNIISQLFLVLLITLVACEPGYQRKEVLQGDALVKFDLQGHRGARGLAPENTVPSFWKALTLGVTTLELDLAVTKDNQLIISHEPWMSNVICNDSLGQPVKEEDRLRYRIRDMTYDQIAKFDCGSRSHPGFPEQDLVKISKPRLIDAIRASEEFIRQRKLVPVNYNIEIKSYPPTDSIFHPKPAIFSDLVYETLVEILPTDRFTIQSFDKRVLQYFHENYPEINLTYLVGSIPYDIPGFDYEGDNGFSANISQLGFNPKIYSPYYKLLDESIIDQIHEQGVLVIPWTVNEIEDMERLFEWKVDGLITDYPNRFWESTIDPREVIEFLH